MKEYLFSYGTLQKEKIQLDLFGRILEGSSDVLRGYTVSTIEITDETFLSKGEGKYQKTLIISDKNHAVNGTALEITGEELLMADRYEPENYKRISVMLESGKEAWIYVAY
jgi:gamma-glutamyl AIG2-like cyclotransferase